MLPIYVQVTPTIAESHVCNVSPKEYDWAVDIRAYLQTGALPEDPKRAHKIRVQASRFTLIGGDLYRRSFGSPYLRCLIQPEIQYVLSELHEIVCGNHSGGRTLAHRAHSQGYYWSTMRQDAEIYVRKCDKCQKHVPIPHMPAETLNSVTSPWPFAQWGMDIVGPLPTAAAQKKFLLVATDYFSKWVEAEAYASIKDKDVKRFVWKNIMCRFGIPQAIIADNGPQFDSSAFKDFCVELHIKNLYSTP
ncbi:Retrovirus-related Pol polyprotein from transposon 412 [Vitis vinifera]|uniref:Retrovirus-related Pol polyprotein from transposon 412 n=1 Tax=Vitis vinifera TaxID=29760 RepID=A0A438CB66_VITVI|nr:Retrovirus-related Pol polyprotein from transposon 412 [Vitis vinifera]